MFWHVSFDENTELNNKIDIYDKQLEDAKVAVLKAASVIQKLNKDIDHERKQKEAYKTTCEELKQKLKERLDSSRTRNDRESDAPQMCGWQRNIAQ